MKQFILLLILLTGVAGFATAQSNPRYFVYLKDKTSSPYVVSKPIEFLSQRSIARRTKQNIAVNENDLPVNPSYLTAIKQTGATVIFTSRWMNALLIEASTAQLDAVKKLGFYKGLERNLPLANVSTASPGMARMASKFEVADVDYGAMRDQLALIGVDKLHQKGFQGENMLIAVLDNGFLNANTIDFFKPMIDEKRVVDTYNFLRRTSNVYSEGSHGLAVLSTIAANKPGSLVGAAFKAQFALYSTESDYLESPYEEVTWLIAAERADSLGADVINSSLGYSTFDGEFNRDGYNYTYANMDGKTALISRAARFASRTGMLVVSAAGNEGSNGWHYIVAPSDVDSVLTVGATNYLRNYAPFSSVGPNSAGLMKPDIAAMGASAIIGNASGYVSGGSGTSYASPQIAGLAAILWQAYPNLTAQKISSVLKRSGHQASAPDNMLGYGVPDGAKALTIIESEIVLGTEKNQIPIMLAPNPVRDEIILSLPATMNGKRASITVVHPAGTTLANRQSIITSDQVSMPSDQLQPGIYLLKVEIENRSQVLKFIKQ